jgi:hypothetical protein
MSSFHANLEELEVKELQMHGVGQRITVAATVPSGYSSRNLFQRVLNSNLNSF